MLFARQTAALLLALTLTAGAALPAFAEEAPAPLPAPPAAGAAAEPAPADPNFLTLNYTAGRDVIRRGDKTDLSVTVKDTALLTRDFTESDYDFSKLLDSFSACTPTWEGLSQEEEPLTLRLTCAGVTYSGTGRDLKLSIARKGSGNPQTLALTVTQAEEYVAPTPAPTPEPVQPKEQAATPVLVTR